jgi:hypothetical protein
VLFASNNHGLRRVPAAGGSVDPVTERDASLEETYHDCPVFLADGRHFLYLGYSETKSENRVLYAGALDEKKRTRLMPSESCAAYAKPGFVLYPRGTKLIARPFDAAGLQFTGEAVSIVDDVATYSNGEVAAFAVSDGGTLVYRKAAPEANRSLVWADRNGRISDPIGAPIQPGAGPDGREIYYVAPSGDLMAVAVTGVDSTFTVGKSSTLFRAPIDVASPGKPYDISADGTRFLVLTPTLRSSPPITTVLNWSTLLKPN